MQEYIETLSGGATQQLELEKKNPDTDLRFTSLGRLI